MSAEEKSAATRYLEKVIEQDGPEFATVAAALMGNSALLMRMKHEGAHGAHVHAVREQLAQWSDLLAMMLDWGPEQRARVLKHAQAATHVAINDLRERAG
jgi:hypothetical protein